MNHAVNSFVNYNRAGTLNTRHINSILLINQGDVTVRLNGVVRVKPGMAFSLSQVQPNVVDATTYSIQFDLTDADTTGTNNDLAVITTSITNNSNDNGTANCNNF